MNNGLTYEEIIELLPAYALGALEPDEMIAVEDYLEEQRALLTRVERLLLATTQLAHVAPFTPISPKVKATLMTQVRAEAIPPQAIRLLTAADQVANNPLAPPRNTPLLPARWQEPTYALARYQPPGTPQPVSRRRFDFGWMAAAVMSLAALFVIWLDFGAQRQLTQLQAVLSQRDVQITQLNGQLQVLQDQVLQNQLQLTFFANPSQIVPLAGTENAPDAGGVFYQHDTNALVVLHGLPPLPADQTYQLWLIPAVGVPTSAGLLTTQSADVNRLQVSLRAVGLDYNGVGISIEPAGGSPTPTIDNIVLLGEKV